MKIKPVMIKIFHFDSDIIEEIHFIPNKAGKWNDSRYQCSLYWHREDGPAHIRWIGKKCYKQYFFNDKRYREYEYRQIIREKQISDYFQEILED